MEFKILGPLEVTDDGRSVEITAPKQRALLAVLVLSANRVVSGDRLLEELWGEYPPTGGLNTLKFHVSKLRDALQPDRRTGEEGNVVTRAPGYMLEVGFDDVDAARFERLVREAQGMLASDPTQASVILAETLSLWRGPALADFEDEPFAAIEAGHLEELRLAALEDRISADLATGHHAEVVDELEKLISGHPYRERMWGQLMVALYRCDRQVDALRSYQRLRIVLGEELGIEPSAEIAALEQRILLQDAALNQPGAIQPLGGRLRGYELQEKLGEGAFGVVWRAAQPAVGRDVAVKVIRPKLSNRPDFVRRFEAEAKLVASLEHPHIVPIFDFWRDPDGAYLVMRLMRSGLDPAAAVTWEPVRVLRMAGQIGSGLAYAHRKGLHHADLHPGNVLLDSEGNAYLADFGLATSLNLGTATPPEGYASPEQRRGEPPTVASDIFGLGTLVFRLFSGVDPGAGPLQSLSELRPELPAGIDEVLRRATDPEPPARFGDVDEFLDELRAAVGRGSVAPAVEMGNPYKGLRAFAEADASDFCGRDLMTAELLDAVAQHRLVGVVGPSGSGKSSLVRAGLLPALRAGRVPGSDRWLITDLYPGVDPFVELATALLRVAVVHPDNLIDRLRNPETVVDAINRALPDDTELLVVVDQFEELFTLCPHAEMRRGFMDALRSLLLAPDGRVRIVLTLRADYYGLPLQYQPFGALLRKGVVSIAPPDSGELSEAVRLPAEHVGVDVDPDLVSQIVGDASIQPGGLPLMEYALTQLFDRRSGQTLTVDAYRKIGGLTGALRRWPEEIYASLDDRARDAIRQICLRLTTVDESGHDTRRRVPLSELRQLGIDEAILDSVLDSYGSARLLTLDRDPRTRTPTVEVAHEALFKEWERLHGWIEGRREDLLLQRRFRTAYADWEDGDRDEAYLSEGGWLTQFSTLTEETDLAFTDAEREFLRLSTLREEEIAGRRRRRRRLVGTGLLTLALVATTFGMVAVAQRNNATRQTRIAQQQAVLASQQADLAQDQEAQARQQEQIAEQERLRAEQQERISTARGLSAASVAALNIDPELAVLLAIRAVETTQDVDGTVLREANEALHRAVSANRLVAVTPSEMWGRDLAFSPDGSRLYVGGWGSGQVVDVPSGQIIESIPFEVATVHIAGADNELLVVGGFSGTLSVRDPNSLEELFALEGHGGWVTGLDVAGGGTLLASISPYDGMAYVWDLDAREQIGGFTLDCDPADCPHGVALSDDGALLLTGATIWNVATGERSDIPAAFDGQGGPVALVGEKRAAVGDESLVRVRDLETGEVTNTLYGHTAAVLTIDATDDGRFIATGGREGLALVWEFDETGARRVLTLPGHVGPVWKVKFSNDGRYLTTISGSQEWPAEVVVTWPRHWEVRLWDVSTTGSHEWMTVEAQPFPVSFTADGNQVLGVNTDSGASLWDATTGAESQRFAPPLPGAKTKAVALSPHGRLVAMAGIIAGDNETGWSTVRDATNGEMIRELIPPTSGITPRDVSFSPDGRKLAIAAGSLVQVWDTATWEIEFTVQNPTYAALYGSVAFSPDAKLLATQGFYPETEELAPVTVWDLESGEEITEVYHFQGNGWGSVTLSSDGRMLLTTGLARPIISEPYTGRQLGVLTAPAANAISATFSADGSRIATGEADGTIRLWDATTAEQELVLSAHSGQVAAVAFSPDGTRLASVDKDGALRVWALDVDDLLDLARSQVTRDLADAQCRAYVGEGCPPALAIERLVPSQSETQGPVGISNEAWATARPGGSWQQLETPGPDGHPLLYDTLSNSLVAMSLAGPSVLNRETGQWTPGTPAPGLPEPDPFQEPSLGGAAYHPTLNRVLVQRIDDGATLAYDVDNDSWSELIPGGGAFVGRYGQGMVYDTESDVMVWFGGAEWGRIEEGKHAGLDDTWIYDADQNSWIEPSPATPPPGRVDHAMVYNSDADRVIVFGGSTGFGVGDVLGDTWAYDTNTNTWTEMSPTVSPPARAFTAMWYDPLADLVFLFGGTEDTSWPPLPWKMFGGEELWAYDFDTNTWTLYRTDPNPSYWFGAGVAAFDTQTEAAVLVGGDWYDEDRRYQGPNTTAWTYRHE